MAEVVLFMDPTKPPMTWSKFLEESPSSSIGVDGAVSGPPAFDPKGPRANFNHHEGVPRQETHAACGQVYFAIERGLLDAFTRGGHLRMNVFLNHPDADSCLSYALLAENWGEVKVQSMIENSRLRKLVNLVDRLDVAGWMYQIPEEEKWALTVLAWMFLPYDSFKLSGEMDKKNPDAFRNVVEEVRKRIFQYSQGRAQEIPLDFRYSKKRGGNGWYFIKEIGAQARLAMAMDGVQAFVTVRKAPDGSWSYTVERSSKFVYWFPVLEILSALNMAEGRPEGHSDRWGGADDRGGSPRVSRSHLSPEEVAKVIDSCILDR